MLKLYPLWLMKLALCQGCDNVIKREMMPSKCSVIPWEGVLRTRPASAVGCVGYQAGLGCGSVVIGWDGAVGMAVFGGVPGGGQLG